MKEFFGNITVTRGKEQQFLGINFKIRDDQKVELHAKDQILGAIKMIEDLGEVIDDTVLYPVGKNLQYVNEDTPKLDPKRAEVFHACTAKCLYFQRERGQMLNQQLHSLLHVCPRATKMTGKNKRK